MRTCRSSWSKIKFDQSFSIGKRDTDGTRPYKLTIDSKKERRELLLQAKQIKIKAPEQLKKVVITTDRTPTQRQDRKVLLEELERARRKHHDAKIRDGKIVIPESSSVQLKTKEIPANTKKIEKRKTQPNENQNAMLSLEDTTTDYLQNTIMESDITIPGGTQVGEPSSPEVNRQ